LGYRYYQEGFFIHSYDVDLHGKVFLSVLFNFMLDAASNHVNSLGVGFAPFEGAHIQGYEVSQCEMNFLSERGHVVTSILRHEGNRIGN
jgi:hypothetical protein